MFMTISGHERAALKRVARAMRKRGRTREARLTGHVGSSRVASLRRYDRAMKIYRRWLMFDEPLQSIFLRGGLWDRVDA